MKSESKHYYERGSNARVIGDIVTGCPECKALKLKLSEYVSNRIAKENLIIDLCKQIAEMDKALNEAITEREDHKQEILA